MALCLLPRPPRAFIWTGERHWGGADGWSLWEMGIQQGQGSQGTKTLAEATGLESDQISLSLEAAK